MSIDAYSDRTWRVFIKVGVHSFISVQRHYDKESVKVEFDQISGDFESIPGLSVRRDSTIYDET